jgi:hypothetical protein
MPRARPGFPAAPEAVVATAHPPPVPHVDDFDQSHPDALAVYCSDGRFTEAVEGLLRGLGHPRLDTMTLPGGAALFEVRRSDFMGLETVRSAATFLVRGHAIKHVVLLAHEGCGYYRARSAGGDPERMREAQWADLRAAARWFRDAHPTVEVRLFYARIATPEHGQGRRIAFDRVDELGGHW